MDLLTTIFGHVPEWETAIGGVVLALVLASGLAELLLTLVRRLTGISIHRGLRLASWILLTVVFTPPILELLGEPLRTGIRLREITEWLFASGLRVLLIGMLAYVLLRALRLTVLRFERRLAAAQESAALEDAKRAKTLGDMVHNVASVAIVAVATLMILQELDINIVPILTGAGIAGLAIGFGAQTLVKDVISGFFLILEDQVRVGDVARINGTGGQVEAIHLRTIVLRDLEGAVHVFPCGSVSTLSNLSKDFGYALLDVDVAYRHDPDDVIAVLKQVSEDLRASPTHGHLTLEPLEVFGVQAFGDSSVTIRVRLKTRPLSQFDVTREFRRLVKKAFREAGIEIPFPQREVTIRHLGPGQDDTTPRSESGTQ